MEETQETQTWTGKLPGRGNGNSLQYSCLENSMDRVAWWATVHRVSKSWTQLSTYTSIWEHIYTHSSDVQGHPRWTGKGGEIWQNVVHSCTELHKAMTHVVILVSILWLWFLSIASRTKTTFTKKKMQEGKWLSEEALQIVEKIRDMKSQRRKGMIYPTEFRVPANSKER